MRPWLSTRFCKVAIRRTELAGLAQTALPVKTVAHLVALPHLERGQTVVADAVSAVRAARQGWRGTAEHSGVPLRVIETVCRGSRELSPATRDGPLALLRSLRAVR